MTTIVEGVALPEPTTVGALAARFGGRVDAGADALVIMGVAPVTAARAGQLAPLSSRRRAFVDAARATEAALLVDATLAELVPAGRRWVHDAAAYALARVLELALPPPPPDMRAHAHIEAGAEVDATASIGPGAVIARGATIGPGVRVEPNAVVYGNVRVGARAIIGAGAVIGRPGFGWAPSPEGGVVRVPQLGGVIIEEGAEVGALATVDAGTLGPTVIGRGAKLDAHVHVGHNAVIGAGALIAAQAGFAGSVEIGRGALVGGQAGVADHVRVGPGARLAAKAGVIGDVAAGAVVAGYPAVARERWLRATAEALREGDARQSRGRRSR
ncbi:UDP-3-O-[3-hydroxymyristoyl] glucosamine N-acyltransferase [Minicystis rosea]|nr:UDP-3-O-[3-hydroxymyristoyl] glucosamine N-acyltransferase [Minicystis rosea]